MIQGLMRTINLVLILPLRHISSLLFVYHTVTHLSLFAVPSVGRSSCAPALRARLHSRAELLSALVHARSLRLPSYPSRRMYVVPARTSCDVRN
jgi:hypothetical protein